MGHPDGAHTHGHGGGGLGGPLAAAAGLLIAAAVLPVLLAILHALLIAAAITTGVLLAAAAAVLAWRLRRPAPVPPWQPGALHPPRRPAVPREVHLHLHGATAEDIAAALAQRPATATPPAWPSPHHAADRRSRP